MPSFTTREQSQFSSLGLLAMDGKLTFRSPNRANTFQYFSVVPLRSCDIYSLSILPGIYLFMIVTFLKRLKKHYVLVRMSSFYTGLYSLLCQLQAFFFFLNMCIKVLAEWFLSPE